MANRALLAEVTERRRAESELRELNDTLEHRVTERTAALVVANDALKEAVTIAEKASTAKSEFLTSMSHDLRTPLNAILGFAQLIDSGSPSPTPSQKRSLAQIIKGGWFLLNLINEILDLSSIASGNVRLSLEPVLLMEAIGESSDLAEFSAKQHDIHLSVVPFEKDCMVRADRTRVVQILNNLISNAIKYNKGGGTVEVECNRSTPGRIRIKVKDTGEGLAPDQCEQLFQPFNRLGQETGGVEGTGIGLALCKRLVELMGGAIGVDSTVGKGCVFWIELDLVTSDGARSSPLKTNP